MHYVVVYDVKGDFYTHHQDPAKGRHRQSIESFQKNWTGVLLLPTPKESYQPSKEKVAGLKFLFTYYLASKSLVFHIVLASLFITFFGIGASYYFQGILDYFIPNQALSTLNIVSAGLIIVYLFQYCLNTVVVIYWFC